MNYLINLIVLWLGLFYITPFLGSYLSINPLIKKLVIFTLVVFVQHVYETVRNTLRKNKLNINKIIDRGVHRASLVILGLVILQDVKTLNLISPQFNGLSQMLNTRWGETTFLLLPIFFAITLKCLLRPA